MGGTRNPRVVVSRSKLAMVAEIGPKQVSPDAYTLDIAGE